MEPAHEEPREAPREPSRAPAEPPPAASAGMLSRRIPLWVALVLLVLLIIAFAARTLAVRDAERALETQRTELTRKFEAEKAGLETRAQERVATQTGNAYRLFGKALAWAVRSSMMRGNMDEIDQYFTALVQNERVKLAVLVGPEGKILLASDRQYQGTDFSQHFAATLLEPNEVTLSQEGDVHRLVLPIVGLTSRLGTVLVVYAGS